MDEFDWIRLGLNFFELLACVTGFIYWKKIRHTFWKWFPFYLLAIICVELTGKFLPRGPNVLVYSYVGIPLQFLFYFWLFFKYFEHSKERKWPLIGMVIYILGWLTEIFFLEGIRSGFFSFSYMCGNVILSILVLLFFIRFINSDKVLEYRSDMMFWVCCGLLIFFLGSLPLYGLWNTLAAGFFKIFNVYWKVHMVFDYIMYICFSIAFIWGKPKS